MLCNPGIFFACLIKLKIHFLHTLEGVHRERIQCDLRVNVSALLWPLSLEIASEMVRWHVESRWGFSSDLETVRNDLEELTAFTA